MSRSARPSQVTVFFLLMLSVLMMFVFVLVDINRVAMNKIMLDIAVDQNALMLGSTLTSEAQGISSTTLDSGLRRVEQIGGFFSGYAGLIIGGILIVILLILAAFSGGATAGPAAAIASGLTALGMTAGVAAVVAAIIVAVVLTFGVWAIGEFVRVAGVADQWAADVSLFPDRDTNHRESILSGLLPLISQDKTKVYDTHDVNRNTSRLDKVGRFDWQYAMRLNRLVRKQGQLASWLFWNPPVVTDFRNLQNAMAKLLPGGATDMQKVKDIISNGVQYSYINELALVTFQKTTSEEYFKVNGKALSLGLWGIYKALWGRPLQNTYKIYAKDTTSDLVTGAKGVTDKTNENYNPTFGTDATGDYIISMLYSALIDATKVIDNDKRQMAFDLTGLTPAEIGFTLPDGTKLDMAAVRQKMAAVTGLTNTFPGGFYSTLDTNGDHTGVDAATGKKYSEDGLRGLETPFTDYTEGLDKVMINGTQAKITWTMTYQDTSTTPATTKTKDLDFPLYYSMFHSLTAQEEATLQEMLTTYTASGQSFFAIDDVGIQVKTDDGVRVDKKVALWRDSDDWGQREDYADACQKYNPLDPNKKEEVNYRRTTIHCDPLFNDLKKIGTSSQYPKYGTEAFRRTIDSDCVKDGLDTNGKQKYKDCDKGDDPGGQSLLSGAFWAADRIQQNVKAWLAKDEELDSSGNTVERLVDPSKYISGADVVHIQSTAVPLRDELVKMGKTDLQDKRYLASRNGPLQFKFSETTAPNMSYSNIYKMEAVLNGILGSKVTVDQVMPADMLYWETKLKDMPNHDPGEILPLEKDAISLRVDPVTNLSESGNSFDYGDPLTFDYFVKGLPYLHDHGALQLTKKLYVIENTLRQAKEKVADVKAETQKRIDLLTKVNGFYTKRLTGLATVAASNQGDTYHELVNGLRRSQDVLKAAINRLTTFKSMSVDVLNASIDKLLDETNKDSLPAVRKDIEDAIIGITNTYATALNDDSNVGEMIYAWRDDDGDGGRWHLSFASVEGKLPIPGVATLVDTRFASKWGYSWMTPYCSPKIDTDYDNIEDFNCNRFYRMWVKAGRFDEPKTIMGFPLYSKIKSAQLNGLATVAWTWPHFLKVLTNQLALNEQAAMGEENQYWAGMPGGVKKDLEEKLAKGSILLAGKDDNQNGCSECPTIDGKKLGVYGYAKEFMIRYGMWSRAQLEVGFGYSKKDNYNSADYSVTRNIDEPSGDWQINIVATGSDYGEKVGKTHEEYVTRDP